MNILILGAGAMGSLLGARLAKTHASVFLFSTNRAHMEAIAHGGLQIEELDGTLETYRLATGHEPGSIPFAPDLVLTVVKTYSTQEAVTSLKGYCLPSTI
ncbi:MAG: 2-dehydropantoate 2-reductase, partial [Desulfobacteraceae bacterium]|nr:2-dehydropantoate 2-reductase [Desulfobacteraceae bacterium]